jgi:flagellar hook-associated protein 1 FlgK
MSDLVTILLTSANALSAYDQVLQTTQNNVANASTPGFARQRLPLAALAFDPPALSGGVTVGQVESSRNEYAEQAVRRQTTALGQQQQLVNSLTSLQSVFDISGNTGIAYALNNFYQSASAWAQNPSDAATRQTFLSRAGDVAQSIQNSAVSLQHFAQDTDSQLHSTVQQVNDLVGQIQAYNRRILESGSASANDAGIDANTHAALEQLSSLVNISATRQEDGTTTILLNGMTPLLIAGKQYSLSVGLTSPPSPPAPYANAPPDAQLLASDGTDITAQATEGQLGALLHVRNTVLPSYQGDAYQVGDLNTLAKSFADRVNQLLTSGNISDGPPPVPGVPLFTYDNTNDTHVAQTLAVDPTVTPGMLSAISPGPPEASNGVPLALSQLATPTDPTDEISGFSYSQFYGNMATNVGSQLQEAQNGVQVQQSLVAQAQSLRQQLSGVDLNEEAMIAVEFQRAYEANSRLVTVLDQLTQDTIDMLQ